MFERPSQRPSLRPSLAGWPKPGRGGRQQRAAGTSVRPYGLKGLGRRTDAPDGAIFAGRTAEIASEKRPASVLVAVLVCVLVSDARLAA